MRKKNITYITIPVVVLQSELGKRRTHCEVFCLSYSFMKADRHLYATQNAIAEAFNRKPHTINVAVMELRNSELLEENSLDVVKEVFDKIEKAENCQNEAILEINKRFKNRKKARKNKKSGTDNPSLQ